MTTHSPNLIHRANVLLLLAVIMAIAVTAADAADSLSSAIAESAVRLDHSDAGDQDDLCFWYDANEPARSLVITSDKKANLIAVYDLQGRLLQLANVPKPGNIDIRQDVDCDGTPRDLIVVNQRTDGWKLALFEVNRKDRKLVRLDNGELKTGPNYGVCWYHNAKQRSLYAVVTSEKGTLEQYQVTVNAKGQPSSSKVRNWELGKCEGAVADDSLGKLYISVEEQGVWELGAEPDQPTPGKLVIRLSEDGLKPDLEGITILKQTEQTGYLLLSSQGQNLFFVYDRAGDHPFLGTFKVQGAEDTDGIDVLAKPLGDQFPQGVFGCHTAATKRCSVILTPWDKIAKELKVSAK